MLLLLLHTVIYVLSVPVCVLGITTETVVGMVGQEVMLPCRLEEVNQRGVEVCWGRGEPSLFGCHNTVINSARERVTYRRSHRFSVSSSSSLVISDSQPSDSGFYHCRLLLPGLFNDQTSSVHLIIIHSHPVFSAVDTSEFSNDKDMGDLNPPQTTTCGITEQRVSVTEPLVAPVQSVVQQQHVKTLPMFVGNTVRLSFIVFLPALLLTAAYRVWKLKPRSETSRRIDRSEEEGTAV